jgi:hypothetical protein
MLHLQDCGDSRAAERGVEREPAQASRLSKEDLASMIESLIDLESAVMIIEWMAEDEKRRAQILEALKSR